MKTRVTYIALCSLLFACAIWGVVLYVAFSLQTEAQTSADSAVQSAQQLDRVAYAQRLSSLASDTKDERDRLEAIVEPDVVAIVNIIEATGKSAHVVATVSDALPEGPAKTLPGGPPLQAVAFVVQAQGSFTGVMRLAALYEKLPLFADVEQLELEHAGSSDPKLGWRLTARIRVMTTSISS